MKKLTYAEAIREAMRTKMSEDDKVLILGKT